MKLERTPGLNPALIFIAPALDVALVLIFFVILSTSFLLQPGIAVTVPDSPFLLAPQRDPQVVSVTAPPSAAVYFDNEQVTFDGLRERLAAQRDRKRTIVVKADKGAAYDNVARVMAVSLELGFPTVLATADGK